LAKDYRTGTRRITSRREAIACLTGKFKPQTTEELTQLASQFHDENTHLIWQRCCVGQKWLNGKVIDGEQQLTWSEVQQILAKVQQEGWRLPTLDELKTLVFTKRGAFITKEGIEFYEKREVEFRLHWITPLGDKYLSKS
jgi:hypothetical protein